MAPKPNNIRRDIFLREIKVILEIAKKEFFKTSKNKVMFLPYAHLASLGIDTSMAREFLTELKDDYKIIEIFSPDTVGMSFDIQFFLPPKNCIENIEDNWLQLQKFSERLISLDEKIFKYNGIEWPLSKEKFNIMKSIFLLAEETGFSMNTITYKKIEDKFKAITGKNNIDSDKITTALNNKKTSRGVFERNKDWDTYNGEKVFKLERGVGVIFRNPII